MTDAELRRQLDECRDEVARLRLLLDVQATIDLPTGLLNMQGMLDPIRGAMDRQARTGEPFAVFVVDLPSLAERDPLARSTALRHAGARVMAAVRSLDRVGRIDETGLVLVTPQLGEAGVPILIERIDRSLGVVQLDAEGDSVDLEPVFTVLLGPPEPMEPEAVLDAIAGARGGASPGRPTIARLGEGG